MAETAPSVSAQRPLVAVFWMVITGLCFVGVTATVKHLGGRVPAAEAAFLRYLLGLVFLVPMWPSLRRARLTRPARRLFWLRGGVHTLGVILWFYAMTRITIAEVTAMNYLVPVYVTLGAAVLLGERLALPRMLAVGAAMVGALIILRPGFRDLDTGHFAMLFTAVFFAASYLIAKRMTAEVSPAVVVAMLSITVTLGLAPFAAAVWITPSLADLGWLFVVAGFATAGHFTMTLAFQAGPMAVTQPVTFLQLLWASLLGALVFAEPVDGWVLVGGVLILGAVSFIAWREARLKARSSPPAPDGQV
ncbi:threonine/homoserine efflux transporter RhtA [Aliiruegeria haliotis]|uniref:Threonine/homoserine efflux transporter RhtA n=1 Tax=Aliiruegeria haliotis TaxID=1280846 RepID=A0A2T0RN13_9RHOB|nr:DMT family transporter [Aliiruegeria haliotis]PRY22596.1 threonine/homoserine efflux transporter RhtA [Aliiruegeria haliotis]